MNKRLEKLSEEFAQKEWPSSNLGFPPSPPFPAPIAYSADKAREALQLIRGSNG